MNRRGAWIPVAGGLLLLLAVGCRTPTAVAPAPSRTILAIDDARADQVLSNYLDLVASRSALRGTARVLLEGPDFKLNRPQRILVERPTRVRLEVLGLFDQLAGMLATDGRLFGFYEVSNGQVARGRVTPTLLWDLAKIDLEVSEVVGLLLAAPMPSSGLARAAVWLEPSGGLALAFAWPNTEPSAECRDDALSALIEPSCFVKIDALDNGGEVFLFDQGGQLAEVRGLDASGVLRFRATFEDYRALENEADAAGEASENRFPNQITVRSPRAGSFARFTWKRVMLARELPDRLFMIPERDAPRDEG